MEFTIGQQLTLVKDAVFFMETLNGVHINEVLLYPEGEVIEILEINENGTYRIKFYTDEYAELNGEKITFSFEKETIASWIEKE